MRNLAQEYWPSSFQQERYYRAQSIHKNWRNTHIVRIVESVGALSTEILSRALYRLVGAYPSLRISLQEVDGTIAQVVSDAVPDDVQSLIRYVVATSIDEARGIIEGLYYEDFDLNRAPLFRVAHITLPDTTYVVFVFNHIISDAVSVALLLRDLSDTYRAMSTGVALQPLSGSGHPGHLAARERARLGTVAARSSLEWWSRLLSPDIRPQPDFSSGEGALKCEVKRLEAHEVDSVRARASSESISFSGLLCSAFAIALRQVIGATTRATIVNQVHANRWQTEDNAVFGDVLELVPIPYGGNGCGDAIESTRIARNIWRQSRDRRLPYWYIASKLSPGSEYSRWGVSPICFNCWPQTIVDIPVNFDLSWRIRFDLSPLPSWAHFDWSLIAQPFSDGSCNIVLGYNSHLFDSSVAANVLAGINERLCSASDRR